MASMNEGLCASLLQDQVGLCSTHRLVSWRARHLPHREWGGATAATSLRKEGHRGPPAQGPLWPLALPLEGSVLFLSSQPPLSQSHSQVSRHQPLHPRPLVPWVVQLKSTVVSPALDSSPKGLRCC